MTEVLVILDGASEPLRGEDEPTSLERARTPVLDALAQLGTLRRLRTTPDGLHAGSETGCAVLLGWQPPSAVDRASLEAAARGIEVGDGQVARRVDVLTAGRERADDALVDRVVAALAADGVSVGDASPTAGAGPAADGDASPTAGAGPAAGAAVVHRIGAHRLLLVGTPKAVEQATVTAASNAPRLQRWEPGAQVPRLLDERTVVIGAPGAVTGLARLLGARTIEPAGYAGTPREPIEPLAEAALAVLAAEADAEANDVPREERVVRLVVHVGAPDEAAHERNAALKVTTLEAADEELLVPLTAAVHEAGGVLEIAIDHGCDPETGEHDGTPTPALRWVAGDDADDGPESDTGLDAEDLPLMAQPKRRASSAAQTGRRLTERWVAPLPIEEPALIGGPAGSASADATSDADSTTTQEQAA